MVFTTELAAAVLATRFSWIKDGNMLADYTPGARGKLQALVITRDADGNAIGPAMLTFTGLSGRQFSEALNAHRESVRMATASEAPAYAFFGVYRSGAVEMVGNGKKSPITTIDYGGGSNGDGGFDPDAAFVGDDALDGLDWAQIEEWETNWNGYVADKRAANNGAYGNSDSGRAPRSAQNAPATATAKSAPERSQKPAPPACGNGPGKSNGNGRGNNNGRDKGHTRASAQQWQTIRGALVKLGYGNGKEKQDTTIRKAGYDPKALTSSQAEELITRLEAALAKKKAAKKKAAEKKTA